MDRSEKDNAAFSCLEGVVMPAEAGISHARRNLIIGADFFFERDLLYLSGIE
jgi:hypothetical protein